MQEPFERILTEERLKHLGSLFGECVGEMYKDSLPKAKFTVYVRTPKDDGKGNESSAFIYQVSDDTVDDETLKKQMDLRHEPLRQCFLDKVSLNTDRDPDRNWVGYFGRVLTLEDEQPSISEEQPSMSNEPIGDLALDESQWIEIIKFSQRRNWFSKIEITPGQVILTVIQLTAPGIWDILKPHLSEEIKIGNERLTELMEKIKNLPLEEVLEKIREILPGLFL